jgi:pimeloyl-ACP methyl ester carboxylesterase
MSFLITLKALYAANGVIGVGLYIPQILRACKDKKQALSLSMVTFGGWSIGAFITTLYAWYFAHDLLFAGLSLANMVAAGTLFLLILHTRLTSMKKPLPRRLLQRAPRPPYLAQALQTPLQISLNNSFIDTVN